MSPVRNPLKLNPLQLKTLVLFQEMASHPETSSPDPRGGAFIAMLPHPHGDHFHIGDKVVATNDATGLGNKSVWTALERKGLIRSSFPYALTVTEAGLAYDSGIASRILHPAFH